MKRILLAAVAFALVSVASCKKEEAAQPGLKSTSVKIEKKDTTQWD